MKIGVVGCGGRMGRMLVAEVLATEGAVLQGAIEQAGSPLIGRDAGDLVGAAAAGVAVTEDPVPLFATADAVLDFTTPAATVAFSRLAAQGRCVHVIGTTGLGPEHMEELHKAARHTRIVQSANMSMGVILLAALVEKVAAALDTDFDIEVFEMHHRHKVDAPSGTALLLGGAAAAGRGVDLHQSAERGRDGVTGPRAPGAIGFSVARGGDVVGEHKVMFAGPGERIELSHIATSRTIYARGAVRAARWAIPHDPGLYTMRDVLGL
ncbi:MAG: 4-hydroxy-tetrahydrodipicolinate reductase [Rhodospirillaceae bacterium]|nr:4-hydroxy-tetrahydrodipicolinate reductase [Rhodospirillaceae bacterium]